MGMAKARPVFALFPILAGGYTQSVVFDIDSDTTRSEYHYVYLSAVVSIDDRRNNA